jgi:hypothetical protein
MFVTGNSGLAQAKDGFAPQKTDMEGHQQTRNPSLNEFDTKAKVQADEEVSMTSKLLEHPKSATGKCFRRLGLGAALGLVAVLAVPAEVSAAPLSGSAVTGKSRATLLELLGSNLQLVHCCHAHPYPPYDEYCCHGTGAYVAGAAVSAGIAYGVYRGVRSSVHHHNVNISRPSRPSAGRPGGGRPGGGGRPRRR